MSKVWRDKLSEFSHIFEGDLHLESNYLALYATDASPYREYPCAVVIVYTQSQLQHFIQFATLNLISIIPRGAGTSLGGQVVGSGVVLDTSHLQGIIETNAEHGWVKVEPGVVLDELNRILYQYNLFFGPETSTSNRCTIGGMVGNNSCGAHSLIYGSTRDQLLEVTGYLADGSEVTFSALSGSEMEQKLIANSFEANIYKGIAKILASPMIRNAIIENYPHPSIHRRNGGYALDNVVQSSWFNSETEAVNLSKLIAGSEGTLMVLSSIKLKLHPLPPKFVGLLVLHCTSLETALLANIFVQQFTPRAVELMDKTILDLTKNNSEQLKNRFFIEGDPQALLIIELACDTQSALDQELTSISEKLTINHFGYHVATLQGSDISRVWNLRKAGLGVLSNMVGDAKPVSVIEDCAVRVNDLPLFCKDITSMLDNYGKSCVFHGHAGSGELHLRPILNLKDPNDVLLFRQIAQDTAHIVKKFRGSMSGEHGDGRVRGEFLELMVGSEVFAVLSEVKHLFDPNNLFNPHKIINTPTMNSSLRYSTTDTKRHIELKLPPFFSENPLYSAERCNGSGDCLKSAIFSGAMCPSYQATKNELFSPRGRANLIREFLTIKESGNSVDMESVIESLKLCLSCKACKSECPSNVDISRLKGELLTFYHATHRISLRTIFFSYIGIISGFLSYFPHFFNAIISTTSFKWLSDRFLGISKFRNLPRLSVHTFEELSRKSISINARSKGDILLLNDEFTNFYNSHVGVVALQFFQRLGYTVTLFTMTQSGRTHLSAGNLSKAQSVINENIERLVPYLSKVTAIVGLEPSVLLTYRDEALELASESQRVVAQQISTLCTTFEEFVASQMDVNLITSDLFTTHTRTLHFHGHCYQKALEKSGVIHRILSLPINYRVEEIKSGCCGMGGGFGYEKEHYAMSTQIAELVLLPRLRSLDSNAAVVTSGFSCKHQIEDLAGKKVSHPVEILFEALL